MSSEAGDIRLASRAVDGPNIRTTALLRVLEGVAVAVKARDEYLQPFAQWLRHYGMVEGDESLSSATVDSSERAIDLALPLSKWRAAITSNPENCNQGVLQLSLVTLAVAFLREKARRGLSVDSTDLDTIWSLVYKAIISAQDTGLQFTVSRSAQGFLAVPLCSLLNNGRIEELWRLHTWLPDGERGVSEEVCIHAHQPFGQSWILLGYGTDCTFEVDHPDDPSLATHAAYECCYTPAHGEQAGSGYQTHQLSSTIKNTGRLVRANLVKREKHSRDMTYVVPGGAYHRSIVSGGRIHATLFVFDAHRGYDETAAVLGPKDGSEYLQPRDPAGLTAETLARIVDVTRKWEQVQRPEEPEEENEHPTVMGYYRFFRGLGLLKAGRREDALLYLNSLPKGHGTTPAHAFAREPLQIHRDYIKMLIGAGADLDRVDESGFTPLNYAAQNGDTDTEALIREYVRQEHR